MKFIVDAQLPRRLAHFIRAEGYDVVHTLDLPEKNRTIDNYIIEISLKENRVVISKDSDFYNRFMDKKEPYKLLYLTVGNCTNNDLLNIFSNNLNLIIELLETCDVIQLSRSKLIVIS